jgi:hypothetical protein
MQPSPASSGRGLGQSDAYSAAEATGGRRTISS